ncbi:MAG: hypothetical protein IPL88_09730 [Rhizobiales bacterium]|nr:hypothetical protein [Hyphomicrobiales bacterium]
MSLRARLAIALVLLAAPAAADEARIGGAVVAYDAARWIAEPRSDTELRLRSLIHDDAFVVVATRAGDAEPSCGAAMRLPFHYGKPRIAAAALDGRPAEKIEARSGCRSAVPPAVAYCARAGRTTYEIRVAAPGCGGFSPFFESRAAADEIAAGTRLPP